MAVGEGWWDGMLQVPAHRPVLSAPLLAHYPDQPLPGRRTDYPIPVFVLTKPETQEDDEGRNGGGKYERRKKRKDDGETGRE